MKRTRVHFLVTAFLLVVLSVLLIDAVVPLQAAKAAICGTGHCIVMCEGENCHCGHVGTDYVVCWCDFLYEIMYC
jgi:hypothetical protein